MKRREQKSKIVATGDNSSDVLKRLAGKPFSNYKLRLYIAGSNLNSSRAIQSVQELCRLLLPSKCELEIIDLYQQPARATQDEIVAAPALIKIFPLPRRALVGDLSDLGKVLTGMGITLANT